jgi:hypothetical protein
MIIYFAGNMSSPPEMRCSLLYKQIGYFHIVIMATIKFFMMNLLHIALK